jgi:murein DD-endopeptidase MepM/ murein hydrolase activator NlpD
MDPFSLGLAILVGSYAASKIFPSSDTSNNQKYTGPIPKNFGVPFAKPNGKAWPVKNGPKIVSYFLPSGSVVGNGATAFGAFRASTGSGERIHAGNDLPAGPSNSILAMEDGIIVGNVGGYVELDAVAIQHSSMVALYAEVALGSLSKAGLKVGSRVKAGQVIAFGSLNYDNNSMLHLELWALGHAPKFFTPWYRGAKPPIGLLDPTEYLLQLART